MALMNAKDRAHAWINIMNVLTPEIDVGDYSVRVELLAAVDAVDDWVDANQASYNAALPDPFKTWATPSQKVAVLAITLHERFNTGTE